MMDDEAAEDERRFQALEYLLRKEELRRERLEAEVEAEGAYALPGGATTDLPPGSVGYEREAILYRVLLSLNEIDVNRVIELTRRVRAAAAASQG